jgi:hypothetical protein
MEIRACRSCDAPIVFITIHGSGKKHPVNASSRKLFVRVAGKDDEYELRDCYESHFATCHDADRFRKAGKK